MCITAKILLRQISYFSYVCLSNVHKPKLEGIFTPFVLIGKLFFFTEQRKRVSSTPCLNKHKFNSMFIHLKQYMNDVKIQ